MKDRVNNSNNFLKFVSTWERIWTSV